MQTISGKIMKTYNKFIGQIITQKNRGNEKFFTRDIIESLKKAEKEIENGEGIVLDDFIRELKEKYEY